MHRKKSRELLIYLAVLLSGTLSLSFLSLLLHLLSHWFWATGGGIPLFIRRLLGMIGLSHLSSTPQLKCFVLVLLMLGTLAFGYLSWRLTLWLGNTRKTETLHAKRHLIFIAKMVGLVLLLVLIVVGYFTVQFYR